MKFSFAKSFTTLLGLKKLIIGRQKQKQLPLFGPQIYSKYGNIDKFNAQVYIIHPAGKWRSLYKSHSKSPIKLVSHQCVLKFGCMLGGTSRHNVHFRVFGKQTKILDSLVTDLSYQAERKFKKWLWNEDMLITGLHCNKKQKDSELVIVQTQEEYDFLISKFSDIVRSLENELLMKLYNRQIGNNNNIIENN